MKRSLFLSLLLANPIFADNSDDKVAPETIAKVAGIVTSFGQVIANPDDSKNVALAICNIIANFLGLAADTRNKIDQPELKIKLQNEIEMALNSGDATQIKALQSTIKNICALQVDALEAYIH